MMTYIHSEKVSGKIEALRYSKLKAKDRGQEIPKNNFRPQIRANFLRFISSRYTMT